ncbi:phosphonate C-P lyase system protein PhnG [Erwinia psidii]|uniref:Phosphonate C-P lyase system protein PhnG n=1 Tax=Erwinia psidii TaxID=69224 RepID=A0A3N6SP00_9GAMM|nr:phosphonate C-P lyase system protein PhnG [Erwinia psidii]MCX8957677.1 phosphonate C-P lyase system protein PhnG [Erwinia psidii]MCX8960732.1 phosphonate C-P lyase system protein PhnG [Erwinia psidii]MCX8964022.1 phosphonate C-P lyase system protein PhnG [Erwinia psidii]RQM39506.1 phosphonate C-P lyase system protein PhnG [Erwinia psidii]
MINTSTRQHWMSVLAHSPASELAKRWQSLHLDVGYHLIRPPEIGLIQVQGRMGGEGNRFLMGDVTVTRAVVQLAERESNDYGYSYVIGRDKAHAELSALIDALLQQPPQHELLQTRLIAPLDKQLNARRARRAQDVATSQVDFFTLVRGED